MKKILKILQLVAAVILALIPKVIEKPCKVMPGKMPMKCFHMSNAVFVIAVSIVILLVIAYIIKDEKIEWGINIAVPVLAIDSFLLAKVVIGGCKHAGAACQMKTIPSVSICSIILAIISIAYLVVLKKSIDER